MNGRVGFSRASAPPAGARPNVIFRLRRQARLDRVQFDVSANSFESIPVFDSAIEVFLLPERLTSSAEESVRVSCSGTFDSAHEIRKRDRRSPKNVDVIGHQNPGVDCAESAFCDLQELIANQGGDLGLAKEGRSGTSLIHEPVVDGKCLTRGQVRAVKTSAGRLGAAECPGDEDRNLRSVTVGQTAAVGSHASNVVLGNETVSLVRNRRGSSPARAKAHPPTP